MKILRLKIMFLVIVFALVGHVENCLPANEGHQKSEKSQLDDTPIGGIDEKDNIQEELGEGVVLEPNKQKSPKEFVIKHWKKVFYLIVPLLASFGLYKGFIEEREKESSDETQSEESDITSVSQTEEELEQETKKLAEEEQTKKIIEGFEILKAKQDKIERELSEERNDEAKGEKTLKKMEEKFKNLEISLKEKEEESKKTLLEKEMIKMIAEGKLTEAEEEMSEEITEAEEEMSEEIKEAAIRTVAGKKGITIEELRKILEGEDTEEKANIEKEIVEEQVIIEEAKEQGISEKELRDLMKEYKETKREIYKIVKIDLKVKKLEKERKMLRETLEKEKK